MNQFKLSAEQQLHISVADMQLRARLTHFDAAGFARLESLSGTRVKTVLPEHSDYLLEEALAGVYVAAIDDYRGTGYDGNLVLVREDRYRAQRRDIHAILEGKPYFLGMVGDCDITWYSPAGPLAANPATKLVLEVGQSGTGYSNVLVGLGVGALLKEHQIIGRYHTFGAAGTWLIGPVGVQINEHCPLDSIWIQGGAIEPTSYIAAGLVGIDLLTYQRLRASGLDPIRARKAVGLVNA